MQRVLLLSACVASLSLTSCQLFQTSDNENAAGTGPRFFSPYDPAQSGAIRLSLQYLNDCAILPTGETIGKGALNLPSYPATCTTFANQGPQPPPATKPLTVLAGTTYFLNQLTLTQTAFALHTDPTNLTPVTEWFKALPRFSKLDWDNLGVVSDTWEPSLRSPSPYAFSHKVLWGNADWQLKTDDSFLVEILDADGTVRGTVTYTKQDFLLENPIGFHVALMWDNDNIAPPTSPGYKGPATAATPSPVGFPPTGPVTYQSFFKMELAGNAGPTKNVKIEESLRGEGSIRVTWSQLPDDPFFFPVTFQDPAEVPAECYSAADRTTRVPCTFGIVPEARFSAPANNSFYVPGETLTFRLAVKDAAGNYLHEQRTLPSWNDFHAGKANGLLYFNSFHFDTTNDRDTITGYQITGPKQAMKPVYELNATEYFTLQNTPMIPGLGNEGLSVIAGAEHNFNVIPGIRDSRPPTTYNVTLPANAKPGTYTLYWKVHRFFRGERFTKIVPFDFQVGQTEKTQFPQRIGNCQICHRGPLSLDNVRHGLSVDYVEGCKSCHVRDGFGAGRIPSQSLIHSVHMTSAKFPFQKNDCSACHLTEESTQRTSYLVCGSCHPEPHGTMFWKLPMTTDYDSKNDMTVYDNCSGACHKDAPSEHINPPAASGAN